MENEMNFDTARQATEEMFGSDSAFPAEENAPAVLPESEEGVPTEVEAPAEEPAANDAVLDDAVQTAEVAAQAAAEKDAQLNAALAQLDALKKQNQALQGTLNELSKSNEQQVIEEALEPPVLDFGALAFANEDEVRAAQAKYAADMVEYSRRELMKELSPFVEEAKAGLYEKEKRDTVATLAELPELSDIESVLPELENIIKNNKFLSSSDVPLEQKLVTAYVIARGVKSMNTPPPEPAKEPTAEELIKLYENNPAFRELIEKKRIDELKHSQQVPPLSASSGAVNAALNIKEKPTTFEEASRRTAEMFGG